MAQITSQRLFGRRVVLTTLDQIPRAFRTAPGAIAISHSEMQALKQGDGETFKSIAAVVTAEDYAELEMAGKRRSRPRCRRVL